MPLSLSAPPEDRAERRQVTVMSSDLVGSTALSARMDPEDLREVNSAYQKCVAETVGRFGGFVAKYMGDGVLIYLGYPQAHEDDAEISLKLSDKLPARTLPWKRPTKDGPKVKFIVWRVKFTACRNLMSLTNQPDGAPWRSKGGCCLAGC